MSFLWTFLRRKIQHEQLLNPFKRSFKAFVDPRPWKYFCQEHEFEPSFRSASFPLKMNAVGIKKEKDWTPTCVKNMFENLHEK